MTARGPLYRLLNTFTCSLESYIENELIIVRDAIMKIGNYYTWKEFWMVKDSLPRFLNMKISGSITLLQFTLIFKRRSEWFINIDIVLTHKTETKRGWVGGGVTLTRIYYRNFDITLSLYYFTKFFTLFNYFRWFRQTRPLLNSYLIFSISHLL